MPPAESTEAATLHAHIRKVDVAVHNIGDAVAHAAMAQVVSGSEKAVKRVALSAEKLCGLLNRELLPVNHTVEDGINSHAAACSPLINHTPLHLNILRPRKPLALPQISSSDQNLLRA